MKSVRFKGSPWANPAYLEEILTYGTLKDWKVLQGLIADQPYGKEAAALEKVLNTNDIYGATPLWRSILSHLRKNS